MTGPIPFPGFFDPVALQIGPFAVRWYALAYIGGLLLGWAYMRALARRAPPVVAPERVGDFVAWAVVGIVLGGRLGYAGFYQPSHFAAHPVEILFVWQGGMSFHGGLVGMAGAIVLFARRNAIPVLGLADMIAAAAPIGLFLGRIANFVNGELYGRATTVPWAFQFPHGGAVGRHPSQLYEAALEGVVLFAALFVAARYTTARMRPGLLVGIFLVGYGLARIVAELFREPDAFMGFLVAGTTMGQWLSVPLVAAGIVFIARAAMLPADRAAPQAR